MKAAFEVFLKGADSDIKDSLAAVQVLTAQAETPAQRADLLAAGNHLAEAILFLDRVKPKPTEVKS